LDQGRVDAVRFHTAAFTNLTRDHLDYHGTMEAYGAAKARLFGWARLAHRVINVDDAFGARLAGAPSSAPLTVTTRAAHAAALRAARRHCRATLRLVFGCGGDRDAGKRPLMGKIAAELADEIIVTDDNPRSEDPRRIVADIVAGMGKRAPLVIEHDRALAIHLALARSGAGDVVLIAG